MTAALALDKLENQGIYLLFSSLFFFRPNLVTDSPSVATLFLLQITWLIESLSAWF
jgi:hypothetical protein